jgi:hypothetical protein
MFEKHSFTLLDAVGDSLNNPTCYISLQNTKKTGVLAPVSYYSLSEFCFGFI